MQEVLNKLLTFDDFDKFAEMMRHHYISMINDNTHNNNDNDNHNYHHHDDNNDHNKELSEEELYDSLLSLGFDSDKILSTIGKQQQKQQGKMSLEEWVEILSTDVNDSNNSNNTHSKVSEIKKNSESKESDKNNNLSDEEIYDTLIGVGLDSDAILKYLSSCNNSNKKNMTIDDFIINITEEMTRSEEKNNNHNTNTDKKDDYNEDYDNNNDNESTIVNPAIPEYIQQFVLEVNNNNSDNINNSTTAEDMNTKFQMSENVLDCFDSNSSSDGILLLISWAKEMKDLKKDVLDAYINNNNNDDNNSIMEEQQRYDVLVRRYLQLEVDRKIASEGCCC